MAHKKLIARLRDRATAYSPQNQQETMLEAAIADRRIDHG